MVHNIASLISLYILIYNITHRIHVWYIYNIDDFPIKTPIYKGFPMAMLDVYDIYNIKYYKCTI